MATKKKSATRKPRAVKMPAALKAAGFKMVNGVAAREIRIGNSVLMQMAVRPDQRLLGNF